MASQGTRGARRTRPDRKRLIELAAEDIETDGDVYEQRHVRGGLIDDDRLEQARFDRCVIEGLTIVGGQAEWLTLRNSDIAHCDWSNATMDSANWSSCIIEESKLTGTRMNQAAIRDVECRECRADYVQLQEARFERVVFRDCTLQHAFFNGSDLAGTVFDGCDLTGADFSRAKIEGSDLRGSRIEQIRIGPEQLRGVIVTQDQALYLAGLLGLDIREA